MGRKLIIFMGVFCLIFATFQFTSVSFGDSDDSLFTAIIAEGGYFQSPEFYLDEGDTIEVQVTVIDGGAIDVYLMASNQFFDAYYEYTGNHTVKSISYLKGEENEREVEFKYKVPEFEEDIGEYYYYDDDFFDSIYIIVDNRNCSLTDYDADSIGIVEVKIDFKITRDTSSDLGPIDEYNIICGVTLIIIIIIIFVLIIYFIRESRNRSKLMGGIPRAQYTYQYPQYPQYTQQYYYQYPGYPPYGAPPPAPGEQPPGPGPWPKKLKAKKRTKVKTE
jgi:hypothetical protein